MKKTLVLGASTNPERYSYKAIIFLKERGHNVIAIGNKKGNVAGVNIAEDFKNYDNIDTITLYLNPQRQEQYYEKILQLQPRRIIFNPGTENVELNQLAEANGIETLEACTLVLLSTDQY